MARNDDRSTCLALAREAAILARLHHPAVLPVYDFFEANGWMALVLAFDGDVSVDRIVSTIGSQHESLDLDTAQFVTLAVFDALAHAHGKKGLDGNPLVHGDVHPENILVRSTGQVLLRGFRGAEPISMVRAEIDPRIDPGPYAAPEVVLGAPPSMKSDLYAAAAIAWLLFRGRPLGNLEKGSFSQSFPELSPEVAAALDTCLSADPDRRCLRANTMAATLRKAIDLRQARDSLTQVFSFVLQKLPKSIQNLSADSLATPCPAEVLAPTDESENLVRASFTQEQQVRDTLVDPVESLEPSVAFLLTDQMILSKEKQEQARKEPISLSPVARDHSVPDGNARPFHRGAWYVISTAAVLTLTLASWMLGRHWIGPFWSSMSESGEQAMTHTPVALDFPTKPPTVEPPTVEPPTVEPPKVEHPTVEPPKVEPPDQPKLAQTPVLFNQSSLLVEGPPEGIVFVNGIPCGTTGERFVARGCGLRFIRVGSSTKSMTSRFRWLSRGQTAMLPCGGSASISVVE